MPRVLLITNPAAARTDARAVLAVRDTLRRAGWRVEVLATAAPGDARRFATEAATEGHGGVRRPPVGWAGTARPCRWRPGSWGAESR